MGISTTTIRPLKDTETASIEFESTFLGNKGIEYAIVFNGVSANAAGSIPNGTEAIISKCKGDFDVVPPGNETRTQSCKAKVLGGNFTLKTNSGLSPSADECILKPGEKYYLNLRWTDYDQSHNGVGCNTAGGCTTTVTANYSVGKENVLPCTVGQEFQRYDLTQANPSGALEIFGSEILNLRDSESATIAFRSTYIENGDVKGISSFTLSKNLNFGSQFDGAQIYVSECAANFDTVPPGNESAPSNCRIFFDGPTGQIKFGDNAGECKLKDNQVYYINVRWKNPITGASTCKITEGCRATFTTEYKLIDTVTPPETNCTTKSVDYYRSYPAQTYTGEDINGLLSNQTASIEFFPTSESGIKKGLGFIIYTPTPGQNGFNGIEAVISECKGDFDNIPSGNEEYGNDACRVFGATFSMKLNTSTLPKNSILPSLRRSTCLLNPNKKYFLNMRFKNPNNPNIPSCTDPNGCGLYVALGYNDGGGSGTGSPQTTCTSKPVQIYENNESGQTTRLVATLSQNQVATVRIPPKSQLNNAKSFSISYSSPAPETGLPAPKKLEIFISECKGDFDTIPVGNSYAGGLTLASTGSFVCVWNKNDVKFDEILLNPAKEYFVNVRWIKQPAESSSKIGFYLDWNYSF